MRKHFLILMLLTLLPFTAWAADFITEATATADDTYFGLAPSESTVSVVVNNVRLATDGTQYTIDKTSGNVNYYLDASCNAKASLVSGSTTPAVGTYYLKINATEPANHNWVAAEVEVKARPLQVTIANGTGQGTKAFNNKDNNDPAEVYGAITAIAQWTATDTYTAITGTPFTTLKNTMTVTRAAGKDVKSNYDYKVSTTNSNYTINVVAGDKYSITKRTFPTTRGTTGNTYSVTVSDNEKTYNGAFQYATVTVVDNEIGYTLAQATLKPNGTVNKANDYTVKYDGAVSVSDYDADDYVISFETSGNYATSTTTLNATGDKKLKIAQKALTIIVDDVTKAYNSDDDIPATTLTYSGLVGADVSKANPFGVNAFVIEYADATGEEYLVGTYPLVARKKVLADFTGTSATTDFADYEAALNATTYPNYKVVFSAIGQLTVDPRDVTITVADKEKYFGDAEPSFTFAVAAPASASDNTGALDATVISGTTDTDKDMLEGLFSVVRSNADVQAVGEYSEVLVLQAKAVADQSDEEKLLLLQYNIIEEKGDFEIKTAALTVFPKKKTITYGQTYSLSEFEVIATNNSGQRVTLTSNPTVKFKEAAYNTNNPKNAGIYTMIVDGEITAAGYDGEHATRNEGQFIINPKALTAVLDDQVLMVGDTKAALLNTKVTFEDNDGNDGVEGADVIGFALDFNVGDDPGQIEYDTDVYTQDEADTYNATSLTDALDWTGSLTAGVKFGDTGAMTAANYNAKVQPTTDVNDGDAITSAHIAAAKAYNSGLAGHKSAGDAKASGEKKGLNPVTLELTKAGNWTAGVKIALDNTVAGNANANYDINVAATAGLTVVVNNALALNSDDDDLANIVKLDGVAVPVTLDLNARTQTPRTTSAYTGDAPAKRKWDAQKWNTLVLPFDIEVAELSYKLGYAVVNVLDKAHTTGTNVAFKLEMGTIPANTPFTIKTAKKLIKETGDAADTYVSETGIINFGSHEINAPTAAQMVGADAGNGCLFVPVYATKTVDSSEKDVVRFLMGNGDKWGRVATVGIEWDVVPFAAYIDLTGAGENAREMTFTFQEADGSTTTIKAIDIDAADSVKGYKVDGWYTLNGVKLQAAPTEKGVYINNGKKVVIK